MTRRVIFLFSLALLVVLHTAAGVDKPSLVVVISVDQMRADYLERFRPYFTDAGFRRFLDHGAVFLEARQRHAITTTGPGHAAIGTGLDPRDSGIVGNDWYDEVRHREVYCVADARVQWIALEGDASKVKAAPASPVLEDNASLGDRWKEKFPGSRVVGLALKDRAAVLMAGRKADAVLWFEEGLREFVTSTYYPPYPQLLEFDRTLSGFFATAEHQGWPLSGRIPEAALEKITFDPPALYGAKDPPPGYGASFPHALADVHEVLSSPWGDDLTLAFCRSIIEKMRLGSDPSRPDLLFLGLSSTDYYGHWFGPDSKEIADGMVRLDAALTKFFSWLDGAVGRDRVLVFLTADHGVTPLPEVARAKNKVRTGRDDPTIAGRINFSDARGSQPKVRELPAERLALESSLAKRFGYPLDSGATAASEGAVATFEEPSFWLNRAVVARRQLSVEAVKQAVRDWSAEQSGVLEAFTDTQISDGLPAAAPYALAIERSFRADRSGDVLVILKPGWMWSSGRQAGTTHGQPNDDDTRVPLAAFGPGVLAGSWGPKVSPLSIARSVGALFGFEAGEPDAEVLDPILGRPIGVKAMEKAANR